jgi:hypothetical protein
MAVFLRQPDNQGTTGMLDSAAYSQGIKAATNAISDGVPRWVKTEPCAVGECIDDYSGLPVMRVSGPQQRQDWLTSFARAFNDTIQAALDAGTITVDFRPLLMSRDELLQALTDHSLGTLSLESPRVESHNPEFSLEVRLQHRKRDTLIWIRFINSSGDEWPEFELYDGPLDVATGREGKVVVFRSRCTLSSRCLETTQVLNVFRL